MKIVIAGMGLTGVYLAEMASKEQHDILVIDENKHMIDEITDRLNVSGICGNAASMEVLMQAGAHLADMFVALTPYDETNVLSCCMAKMLGTKYTVARMDNPDMKGNIKLLGDSFPSIQSRFLNVGKQEAEIYAKSSIAGFETKEEHAFYKEAFQIDYIVTPKEDIAEAIMRHIGLPGTVRAEGFFHSNVTLIRIHVDENSPLNGMAVKDVRHFMETDMLVGVVVRGDKAVIPTAAFCMKAEDMVSIIVPNVNLLTIMKKLNLVRGEVKNVLIIGGGVAAYYLSCELLKNKKKVTILENDKNRCMELLELLPDAKISYVEKIDAEVLKEEGIDKADVCVSLTGRDDTNLVLSMFAWSCGVESVITKVNSTSYEHLLNKVSIDITLSPAEISASNVIGFIRNKAVPNVEGNDITCVYSIAGGLAEAVELKAYDNFKMKNIQFKHDSFQLKKETIIAAIIRENQVMVPDGNSCIMPGDSVVVLTKDRNHVMTLNDIL